MAKESIFMMAIMGFVVVIIGLSFLSTSADSVSSVTDTYSISAVTYTLINGTPVSVIPADHIFTAVSSVTQGGNTLTVNTHYEVDNDGGTINLTGVTYGNGTYNVTATYTNDSYISDSAARSTTTLIIIMFAVAIFLSVLQFIDWKSFGM